MVITAIQKKKEVALLKKLDICKDFYEQRAWAKGQLVCGIDEVGRGCLAGPVVICAAILPVNCDIANLKDSKLMSADMRQKVSDKLISSAWYAFGILDQSEIDDLNIWHATLKGMKKAAMSLFSTCPQLPSTIVVDAMPLKLSGTRYGDIELHNFPFGESISRSIAAASILAKVKRDSMMCQLEQIMPGYGLDQNKGYGTPKHQDALKQNGQSLLHRQNFLKKYEVRELYEEWSQGRIFCRDS
jgi:ribonuclease HII